MYRKCKSNILFLKFRNCPLKTYLFKYLLSGMFDKSEPNLHENKYNFSIYFN